LTAPATHISSTPWESWQSPMVTNKNKW